MRVNDWHHMLSLSSPSWSQSSIPTWDVHVCHHQWTMTARCSSHVPSFLQEHLLLVLCMTESPSWEGNCPPCVTSCPLETSKLLNPILCALGLYLRLITVVRHGHGVTKKESTEMRPLTDIHRHKNTDTYHTIVCCLRSAKSYLIKTHFPPQM